MDNENINNKLKEEFGDKLMDHDYDGITELDNPTPTWIMAVFFVTILFSIAYGVYYFMMDGPTQHEEWAKADSLHSLKFKDAQNATIEIKLIENDAELAEGKAIYEKNCASCHQADGKGLVGPNLTDDKWLHGCDIESVFNVIKTGVPKTSMVSYERLGNDKILKAASYIVAKLKDSNAEGGIPPQGEACN